VSEGSKAYLGDSVYADIENGTVKLTTENGFGASNTIFLEPDVIRLFIMYLADHTTLGGQLTDAMQYRDGESPDTIP
jgi:hypothetical protein